MWKTLNLMGHYLEMEISMHCCDWLIVFISQFLRPLVQHAMLCVLMLGMASAVIELHMFEPKSEKK